jgi:hypothetical protein
MQCLVEVRAFLQLLITERTAVVVPEDFNNNVAPPECQHSYDIRCYRRLSGWWAKRNTISVRFEVFTAVTMKNGVFWDVTPCGSCKNRRFGGT